MSDKKVFAIDPTLFSFANTTRKKRGKDNSDTKIKIKPSNKANNNMSLKKRSIINMMRKHQETQYTDKFAQPGGKQSSIQQDVSTFQSDFDNAKEYFTNLQRNISKKNVISNHSSNHTLKQYGPVPTTKVQTIIPLPSLNDVTGSISATSTMPATIINSHKLPQPTFGCLKNGTLPTYRTIMNQTRKNIPESKYTMHNDNRIKTESVGGTNSSIIDKPAVSELVKTAIASNHIQTKLTNLDKNKFKPRKQKRKKTIRRTYKIGRSKIMPKVSVLVSNKTIRRNITTKTHLIKQTPIHEIRKYLIRHGFIRVGAVTPNDVLRKMYESAMLICGEIQNHNPDNLLYNFLHDPEK